MGIIHACIHFQWPTKRNSAVVQFEGCEFGEIQFYAHTMVSTFAMYEPLEVQPSTLVSSVFFFMQ